MVLSPAFGVCSRAWSQVRTIPQTETVSSGDVAAGRALLRARNYSAAMDRFEAGLAKDPTDPEARKEEIAAATAWAAATAAKTPEQSMEVLERALHQFPDEPQLLLSFGLEAVALGQFPIAEQALQTAQKLRPDDPEMVYALARLELEEQHLPDAERDLKAYVHKRPQDATAYFGLGHVYAMEQRDDEARAAFERSIQLRPGQTESYYQVGQLDLEAHQDTEARKYFEKVLTRDPNHAGALTGMGELALRAKDYGKAETYLSAAEKSDPSYQTPHYFRGLALAKLGRKEEAEQEMRLGDSRQHATDPRTNGAPAEDKASPASLPPGA